MTEEGGFAPTGLWEDLPAEFLPEVLPGTSVRIEMLMDECSGGVNKTSKEDDMEKKDKPLSEWTLGDVKQNCKRNITDERECWNCPFEYKTCGSGSGRIPANWDIDEIPVAEDTNVPDKPAKPRLAEILGVEVGERFNIDGYFQNGNTRVAFWVTEKGCYETDPPKTDNSSYALLDAINHPESIIRAPRLTEAELAICKAVGAKWVSKDERISQDINLWESKPKKDEIGTFSGQWFGRIHGALFPSVRPGDCLEVPGDA